MPVCSFCGRPVHFLDLDCRICGVAITSEAVAEGVVAPVEALSAVNDGFPELIVAEESAVPSIPRMSTGRCRMIRGTVIRTDEPRMIDGSRDGWANACVLVIIAGLLPVAMGLWLMTMSLHLLLWVFGLGLISFGGVCGLIASLLLHHILERALRKPDPTPVYHHVIEIEGHGQQELVRQDGKFAVGRIYAGNQVRLQGRRRDGVFVIDGGHNDSLRVPLRCRRSGWRIVYFALASDRNLLREAVFRRFYRFQGNPSSLSGITAPYV